MDFVLHNNILRLFFGVIQKYFGEAYILESQQNDDWLFMTGQYLTKMSIC